MKKLIIGLVALCMANAAVAQFQKEKYAEPGIFNHLDIGVTAGTMGIGADLTMPIGKSVRIRAGYTYMPVKFRSDFPIETRNGRFSESDIQKFMGKKANLEKEFTKYGIDINAPKFAWWKEKIDRFRDIELTDQVTMNLKPNAHQFKLLVDVMPLRNKHWSFTAGLFIGNSNIGNAINSDAHTKILEGVAAYNEMYLKYCTEGGIEGNEIKLNGKDIFYSRGIAGWKLGYFNENGNLAIMVPGKDNTARAEMEVSKVRPYLGFAYNTHLSKNHRWNMNVDAGIMLLCGKPKVFVNNVYSIDESKIDIENWYYDIIRPLPDGSDWDEPDTPLDGVNIMEDLKDIPGKVGDLVNLASKMKVYPNLSVTFSYRLF